MNRIAFLKNLAAAGAALLTNIPKARAALLAPANALPSAPISVSPVWKAVPIYRCFVRGFQYHAGPALLSQMQHLDPLDLVWEQGNPHDYRAIAVYWQQQQIGFIPREDNKVFHAVLAGGLPVYAHIRRLQPESETWRQLRISVYLITAPELLNPETTAEPDEILSLTTDPDKGWLRIPAAPIPPPES